MIEPIQPTIPTNKKLCCQPHPFLLMVLSVLVIAGSLCVGVTIGRGQTRSVVTPPIVAQPPITSEPTSLPTSAPTADWKTYENKTYKYSIKYPDTFIVVENSALAENSVGICKQKDLDTYCVSIYPTKQTEAQFLKEKIVKDVAVDNSDVIPEKVKIGDIDATAISIGTAMGFGSRYYFVSKDKTNLIIHIIINDSSEKDKELIQILSTFKFTN